MSKNIWLTDESFLNSLGYYDSYYLRNLCDFLFAYLKKIPIPILTRYVNKSIEIRIGEHFKVFPITTKIYPRDWITLVDNWLSQYFPRYLIKFKKNRFLTEEETIHYLNTGKYTTDEVFEIQIEDLVEEFGIIERMYKRKEEFRFTCNGITSIRHAGGSNKENLLVSEFIKKCNLLEKESLKDYIMNHSRHVSYIDTEKEVFVNHKGLQLINFFIVNKDYILVNQELVINSLTGKFGKFLIEFESLSHKVDCLKALSRDNVIF
jgi:hypothetical protein